MSRLAARCFPVTGVESSELKLLARASLYKEIGF
jgi:hypothetical protein